MLKSMTAFGRASTENSIGHFTAEIQSVNRKYLEINCYLPKELVRFEADIRQWVGGCVSRGQINLRVFAFFEKASPLVVKPNLGLCKQVKMAWEQIGKELGLSDAVTLAMMSRREDLLLYEEDLQNEETVRKELRTVIDLALQPFLEMKKREGAELYADIASRLKRLGEWIEQVAVRATGASSKFRQKLIERINEVAAGLADNEDKILREVAIYAEKVDITEEIIRFRSHLKQVDQLVNTPHESIGKKFEFLLQELNREANTIGSKSNDIETVQLVVEIKTELERIREQIQNIE
jgi:uncharacterized protein (TIGR00255 family)